MKYQVVVADPPYGFGDKLKMSAVKRGADANYNGTMTVADICALSVKLIADPDGCILALWVPSSMMADGLKIMTAWGFQQKQSYVWVKTKKDTSIFELLTTGLFRIQGISGRIKYLYDNLMSMGMGRLFRNSHEICLIGTNNNAIYKKLENHSQRSVCFASNLKHSAKPEDLQKSLDIMFPSSNKIELFARRKREGWLCIGNQAPATMDEDIRISLQKIIDGQ